MLAIHNQVRRDSNAKPLSPRASANRRLLQGFIALWFSSSLGCSICPSPYDYDYGAYGTKTPRTDMRHGRVGSVLSDPALGAPIQSQSIGFESSNTQSFGEVLWDGPVDGLMSEGTIIIEE